MALYHSQMQRHVLKSCISLKLLYSMYSMAKPCLYIYEANYQVNIKSCARVKLHSFEVCEFNPTKENFFRENWLIFWGIWGEAELFLGIGEQRQNIFREQGK